jgi:hypothetical protein
LDLASGNESGRQTSRNLLMLPWIPSDDAVRSYEGRLAFYWFDRRLHEQRKSFEGKNDSLEVIGAEQPVHAGLAMIQLFGRIRAQPF